MGNESLFAGSGLVDIRRRIKAGYEDALAEREAAYEQRKARALAEQQAIAAQQAQGAQGAQPGDTPSNPLMDPEGGFAQYLKTQHGLTLDDVFNTGVSSIQREREYVMPYLEEKWRTENAPIAQQQGLLGSKLRQARDDYFRMGRAYGLADFSDRQAEIDTVGRVGSALNAAGRGLVGLGESASGLIKTAAGDKNIASDWIDAGTNVATQILRDANNPEQQELVDYLHGLAERGEYSKMAKLVVDYPFLAADQAVEQVAAFGGFGKGLQGLSAVSKLDKVAKTAGVSKKLADIGKVAAYSGYQSAGSVAQELSRAGIDPSDEGARNNVMFAGLTSAAIGALTPATLEKTAINNLMGKGVSEQSAKILARDTLAKMQAGGLLKTPLRYGAGLSKNVLKGAVGEGLEEYGQSGAEAAYVAQTRPDGTDKGFAGMTDADWENVERRAGSGAVLGAVLGGATKGSTNVLSKYGDTAKSQLVADNARYWNDAETRGEYTAPENARGKTAALREAAEARKAEIEAEKARAEQEQAILDDLKAKYGDFATEAKSDFDIIANRPTIDTDSAINAVVGKGNGTPATVEEAQQQLNETPDATARANLLKQWATATNDKTIQDIVNPIADEVSKVVEPSTAEADTTIADSLAVATKRDVTSNNVEAELDSFAKGRGVLEQLASQYKQAKADGYTATANAIADKFAAEVQKQIGSGKITTEPELSDALRTAKDNSLTGVVGIVSMLDGTKGWNKANRAEFNTDPKGYIDELITRLREIPPQSDIDPVRIKAVQQKLQDVRASWDTDSPIHFELSPEDITWLKSLK